MAAVSQSSIVISTYRSLARLVRQLPDKQQLGGWKELRDGYRKNAKETSPETISNLIEEAGKKIAFLRIVTPKKATNQIGVTRWVYRASGEKDTNGRATMRKTQQVVSNFDGKNLGKRLLVGIGHFTPLIRGEIILFVGPCCTCETRV